jgi:hypothetical protein
LPTIWLLHCVEHARCFHRPAKDAQIKTDGSRCLTAVFLVTSGTLRSLLNDRTARVCWHLFTAPLWMTTAANVLEAALAGTEGPWLAHTVLYRAAIAALSGHGVAHAAVLDAASGRTSSPLMIYPECGLVLTSSGSPAAATSRQHAKVRAVSMTDELTLYCLLSNRGAGGGSAQLLSCHIRCANVPLADRWTAQRQLTSTNLLADWLLRVDSRIRAPAFGAPSSPLFRLDDTSGERIASFLGPTSLAAFAAASRRSLDWCNRDGPWGCVLQRWAGASVELEKCVSTALAALTAPEPAAAGGGSRPGAGNVAEADQRREMPKSDGGLPVPDAVAGGTSRRGVTSTAVAARDGGGSAGAGCSADGTSAPAGGSVVAITATPVVPVRWCRNWLAARTVTGWVREKREAVEEQATAFARARRRIRGGIGGPEEGFPPFYGGGGSGLPTYYPPPPPSFVSPPGPLPMPFEAPGPGLESGSSGSDRLSLNGGRGAVVDSLLLRDGASPSRHTDVAMGGVGTGSGPHFSRGLALPPSLRGASDFGGGFGGF